MKKIMPLVASIAIILIAGIFASAGTMAWYSDTETSEGNVLKAGDLDLKVGGSKYKDDPYVKHVSLKDVKPGDTIYVYWKLKNVGSICGQPSIEFANIANYENGITEPEKNVGDTTPNVGELGGLLYVLMKWRQPVGSGAWHEIKMVMFGHTKLNCLTGPYGLGENEADPIPELCKGEEVEIELRLWWDGRFNTPGDNIAQTDSVEFDVIFHLDQVP